LNQAWRSGIIINENVSDSDTFNSIFPLFLVLTTEGSMVYVNYRKIYFSLTILYIKDANKSRSTNCSPNRNLSFKNSCLLTCCSMLTIKAKYRNFDWFASAHSKDEKVYRNTSKSERKILFRAQNKSCHKGYADRFILELLARSGAYF